MSRFGAETIKKRGWWYVQFTLEGLRRYCLNTLYHEVGHHVDWYYRNWTAANRRQTEEEAEQYAVRFTPTGAEVLAGLGGGG